MNETRSPEQRLARLMERLRSHDEAVRIHAALRLAGPGIDPVLARPELSAALRDPDEAVRKLAAWLLARLAAPAAAA